VRLDCTSFKEKILKHILELVEYLEQYVKKEFISKMSSIQFDINSMKQKLEENVQSIDEVIMLLDYIDVIKRPDNKVDEYTN
jgi:hypothetical protein